MFPRQPALGSQPPEPIPDGSPPRVLQLETNKFPIKDVPEDVPRIHKVLLPHHLILADARWIVEGGLCSQSRVRGTRALNWLTQGSFEHRNSPETVVYRAQPTSMKPCHRQLAFSSCSVW